ncbi:hypothetical protein [Haloarcula regularis]|uniref:hypothetical protein n=1 Tax=Haloarcula regularis TaxID=3033392 RepID=UPI0023E88382|nr:hypothetical protein [Halomicroarcula sp. SYNS111]
MPSRRQWLWLALLFGHLVLPVGLWLAVKIGRPRFVGLALYLVTGVLILDVLLFVGRSSTEAVRDNLIDARVPVILFLASVGLLALLGPGLGFYLGVTATLVTVLVRGLFQDDGRTSGVVNLGLVCLTSALVIVAEVFTVAYYVSVPDNINHTTTAIVLMNEGWLSGISATRYFLFSAFHVLSSTGMLFTQLQPRVFMGILMIGLFQIALVAVYLFFTNWSRSRSLALIATALVSINISFLHYGSVAHYQSMSFVLFCVFLAILTGGEWSPRHVAVATPVVATWIVTHHVSVLMVISMLSVPIGYLAYQIWQRNRQTSERPTVFMFTSFCLIFGVYWTLVTNKFREVIVWTFFSSSAADGIPSRIYLVQAYESLAALFRQSIPFHRQSALLVFARTDRTWRHRRVSYPAVAGDALAPRCARVRPRCDPLLPQPGLGTTRRVDPVQSVAADGPPILASHPGRRLPTRDSADRRLDAATRACRGRHRCTRLHDRDLRHDPPRTDRHGGDREGVTAVPLRRGTRGHGVHALVSR